MQIRVIGSTLIALAAIMLAGAPVAAETAPNAQGPAGHPTVMGNLPAKKKVTAVPAEKLVDINSAKREQLMRLPGIGNAEAEKIIAGRPYLSKADLATKNVLPTGVYVSIKKLIIAKQTGKPNLKK